MKWLRRIVIRHDAALFGVVAGALRRPWTLIWDLGNTSVYRIMLDDDDPVVPYRYYLEWHVAMNVFCLRALDPEGRPYTTVASWYADEDLPPGAAWIVAPGKTWPKERLIQRAKEMPWRVRFCVWLARNVFG